MFERLAALGLVLWAGVAAAQPAWPPEQFNPKPLPGDVLLPMPCGGQMAFRRIETPVRGGRLEDRQVVLGDEDEETAFGEYVRTEFLVGALTDPETKARFYDLGKHEVTVQQHDSVMEAACPAVTPNGRRPKTGLGWFDAVAFTHRYSAWLLANARDRLPADGPARSFVRLPTEIEWEYAARGGAAVSEVDFRQRRFPMAEPIARYAWYQGTESARGRLQLIGMLQPNPLGLFDVLGNAEEIVLDAYRLNRGARLHGQAGGFIGKGGHFRTPRDQLRSSMRTEYPHFGADDGLPLKLDIAGFRVALATPITVDLRRIDELRASWKEERTRQRDQSEQARQQLEGESDPLRLADAIAAQSQAAEHKHAVERIKKALTDERFARNQSDGRAAKSAIGSGAVLIRAIRDYDNRLQATEKLLATVKSQPPASADKARHAERVQTLVETVETIRFSRELTFDIYAGLMLQTAGDAASATLRGELARWKAENGDARRAKLREFGDRFVAAVLRYRENRNPSKDQLLQDILRD